MTYLTFYRFVPSEPFPSSHGRSTQGSGKCLKNLKGIHWSRGKKVSTAAREVVAEVAPILASRLVVVPIDEEPTLVAELQLGKRKTCLQLGLLPVSLLLLRLDLRMTCLGSYQSAIESLPRPGRWGEIEVEGYEVVTSSFVQKWNEVRSVKHF